tara:strand:- start:4332 stop:5513 length:1182 start_codon:yes stop_codon:yes gene_type:complete
MHRVLCLDIEGGYGGSSKSLFQSIKNLPLNKVKPEVWCRRNGPIQDEYRALGVPCRVIPEMSHLSALPKLSRNIYIFSKELKNFNSKRQFREKLAKEVNARFDLVHFNHESLFLLSHWLKKRTNVPFTMHIRTNLVPSIFSRIQAKIIQNSIDRLVFISENEKMSWSKLGLNTDNYSIIYNISGGSDKELAYNTQIPKDNRLKVISLANYAWVRGVDRLIDVANELANRNRSDILFIVAGDMSLRGSLPSYLKQIARVGGGLEDYVESAGLSKMFCFLGHIPQPDTVLSQSDLLLRLSRENNPWGRDVIEALGMGVPVVATGSYDRFIKHGLNGYLIDSFNPQKVADLIINFADNRTLSKHMGEHGRDHIAILCNGKDRANELAEVWKSVISI